MIGFILAILLFNTIAFATNKKLSLNQILHIWCFTVSLQLIFDLYVDVKYQGYWYFEKEIGWTSIPAIVLIVPPVNMIFLNWYPVKSRLLIRIIYFLCWYVLILMYEKIALLPEPWGYFHYGWWNFGISAIINPFLLLILIIFYKLICKLEELACQKRYKKI